MEKSQRISSMAKTMTLSFNITDKSCRNPGFYTSSATKEFCTKKISSLSSKTNKMVAFYSVNTSLTKKLFCEVQKQENKNEQKEIKKEVKKEVKDDKSKSQESTLDEEWKTKLQSLNENWRAIKDDNAKS